MVSVLLIVVGNAFILNRIRSRARPPARVPAEFGGDGAIVPFGEDHFEAGDHVVVFSLPEATSEVVKFFS